MRRIVPLLLTVVAGIALSGVLAACGEEKTQTETATVEETLSVDTVTDREVDRSATVDTVTDQVVDQETKTERDVEVDEQDEVEIETVTTTDSTATTTPTTSSKNTGGTPAQ